MMPLSRSSRRWFGGLVFAAAASPFSGCTDSTGPKATPVPAAMEIISGDAQSGQAGTELATPLVVRVRDENGDPVSGQIVNFRVTSGAGTVFAGAALTNGDGQARERWTLGTSTAVAQTVEARAVDPTTGDALVFATFHATALPGPLAQSTIVSGASQTVAAGGALPDSLLLRATDQYGNPIAGAAVVWTVPAGAGTLVNASPATSATGYASAKWTLGTAVGQYAVSARVAALPPLQFAGGVVPAAAAAIVVDTAPTSAVVYTPTAIVVRVVDAYGNGLPAGTLHVAMLNSQTWYGPADAPLDSTGRVRIAFTLGSLAGPNGVRLTYGSLAPVDVTVMGVAGPATRFTPYLWSAGQVAAPGTTVPAPQVLVQDQYSNPIAGALVSFAVTAGGGTIGAPSAVTNSLGVASVSWTLGAVGANTLVASLSGMTPVTFTVLAQAQSPDVTVDLRSPRNALVVGDSVLVSARVTSRLQLASVRASIAGVPTDLVYNASNLSWERWITVHGSPRDTQQVVVTATDANGSATNAIGTFIHDLPPVISVSSPTGDFTLAQTTVSLAATCSDDDPAGCTELDVSVQSVDGIGLLSSLVRGTTSVSGTFSLAQFAGRDLMLVFCGFDANGPGRLAAGYTSNQCVYRRVRVESAQRAVVAAVPGTVIDYRAGRTLYRRLADSALVIRSAGGADEVLTTAGLPASNAARDQYFFALTPLGAMARVPANSTQADVYTLYEWRNGVRSSVSNVTSFDINASYALFTAGGSLIRRDLVAGTDVVVAANVGSFGNAPNSGVALNGDVAYFIGSTLYRYRAGVSSPLASSTSAYYYSVLTDGSNVVYSKRSTTCCQYSLSLHDGTQEVELVPPTAAFFPEVYRKFAVNNGWTAFTRPDGVGVQQVWLRSPLGVLRQISAIGTSGDVVVNAVSDDGRVVYSVGTSFFLATPSGAVTSLGTEDSAVVRWRDGDFELLAGGWVFRITP